LSGLRVPPVVGGPSLLAASDVQEGAWYEAVTWRQPFSDVEWWIRFEPPAFEDRAVPLETVVDLVRGSHPAEFDDAAQIEFDADDLVLQGPEPLLPPIAETVRRWLALLAPARDAHVVLETVGEDGRVVAAGSARLWPGRWTTATQRRREVPMTAAYHVEIAQGSTNMQPIVAEVPEGHEVYLRFHPGESTDLVEVWSGWLSHVAVEEIDLQGLRSLSGTSVPGVLAQPRTAVRRAYTALPLPATEASRQVVEWRGPEGRLRLTIELAAPVSPPAAPREAGDQRRIRPCRVGALSAGLAFDLRPETSEQFLQGEAAVTDVYASMFSSEIALLDGERTGQERVIASVAGEEARRLVAPTVDLGVLRVPEETFRRALADGSLRVGGPVPDPALAALAAAGSAEGPGVRLPVLLDVEASVRSGDSVTGLLDLESEVAQEAAGLQPISSARFSGLAGGILLQRADVGYLLHSRLALSSADPRTGTLDVAFRGETEPFAPTRVRLPVLGATATMVDAATPLAADGRPALVAASVEGEEVVLLLARVVP
jgi:hypothetical protein